MYKKPILPQLILLKPAYIYNIFQHSMNPWDVARLRINLGDYNIKSKGDGQHIERKVKKVVRHRGFDPQTLVNRTKANFAYSNQTI